MEDKTFELMTRMYAEFSEFRKEITEKVDNNTNAVIELERKVDQNTNSIINLENKIDTNPKALYDGYKLTYEKLSVLENKVDDISVKVENRILK